MLAQIADHDTQEIRERKQSSRRVNGSIKVEILWTVETVLYWLDLPQNIAYVSVSTYLNWEDYQVLTNGYYRIWRGLHCHLLGRPIVRVLHIRESRVQLLPRRH